MYYTASYRLISGWIELQIRLHMLLFPGIQILGYMMLLEFYSNNLCYMHVYFDWIWGFAYGYENMSKYIYISQW